MLRRTLSGIIEQSLVGLGTLFEERVFTEFDNCLGGINGQRKMGRTVIFSVEFGAGTLVEGGTCLQSQRGCASDTSIFGRREL